MDEVLELCERASVLRDGRYVTTLDLAKTTGQELVQNMIGRDVSMYAKRTRPSRVQPETVLKVTGLSGEAGFQNISFELKKGEILGFAGLVGAMRTEVMRAIFGADKALSGEVYHKGRKLEHRTPARVSEDGIGLISENRKEEGFVKTLTTPTTSR